MFENLNIEHCQSKYPTKGRLLIVLVYWMFAFAVKQLLVWNNLLYIRQVCNFAKSVILKFWCSLYYGMNGNTGGLQKSDRSPFNIWSQSLYGRKLLNKNTSDFIKKW